MDKIIQSAEQFFILLMNNKGIASVLFGFDIVSFAYTAFKLAEKALSLFKCFFITSKKYYLKFAESIKNEVESQVVTTKKEATPFFGILVYIIALLGFLFFVSRQSPEKTKVFALVIGFLLIVFLIESLASNRPKEEDLKLVVGEFTD